jgi:hypothetical protein
MANFNETLQKFSESNKTAEITIKGQDKPLEVNMVDKKFTAADKEEKNAQERGEKERTALLQDIAAGISNMTKSLVEGLKKLTDPALMGLGLLAGLLLAPLVVLASFFKQLAVEVKFFAGLIGKLGGIFKPIKNLFNWIKGLSLGWVDDFKKSNLFGKIKSLFNWIKNLKLSWIDDLKNITFDKIKSLGRFFRRIMSSIGFFDDIDLGISAKNLARIRKAVNAIKSGFRFIGSLIGIAGFIFTSGVKTLVKTFGIAIKSIMLTFKLIRGGITTTGALVKSIGSVVKFVTGSIFKLVGSIFRIFGFLFRVVGVVTNVAKSSMGFMKLFGPIFTFASKIGTFLGKIFLPITIIMGIFDFVSGFIEGYQEGGIVEGFKQGLASLFDGLIGSVMGMIGSGLNTILSFVGLNNLGAAIEKALDDTVTGIKDIISGAVDLVMGIFTLDTALIMKSLSDIWSGFEKILPSIFLVLEGLINDVFNFLGFDLGWNPLTIIKDFFLPVYNWIKGFFTFGSEDEPESESSILTILSNLLTGVWGWFKSIFTIGGKFPTSLDDVTTILKNLTNGVWTWFKGLFDWVPDWIPPVLDSVLGVLTKLGSAVWTWFKGLFGFGKDKEPVSVNSVIGTLTGLVTGVWNWFKSLFDFSSVETSIASIINVITLPYTILLELAKGVWNWFAGIFGFDTVDTGKAESDGVSVGGIGGLLTSLVKDIWAWFTGLFTLPSFDTIIEAGKGLFDIVTTKINSFLAIFPTVDDLLQFLPKFKTITDKVIEVKAFILAKLATFLSGIPTWEDITGFLPSFDTITTKIDGVKAAIALGIANFLSIFPTWETITSFLPKWDSVTSKIDAVKTSVVQGITNFLALFPTWESLSAFLPTWSDLTTPITTLKTSIETKVKTFIDSIPTLEDITGFLPDINDIVEKAKTFGKDAIASLTGLFSFGSIEEAVKSAINLFFLPTNMIVALVKGAWNWITGLFGYDTEKKTATIDAKTPSFLEGGGIGQIVIDIAKGLWNSITAMFAFGTGKDLTKEQMGELKKLEDMLSPMKLLENFAKSIKGFFEDIFDMDKIKGFFSDIPLIGSFFGSSGENKQADDGGKSLMTPIDTQGLLSSIFGEVNILDYISKFFTNAFFNIIDFLAIKLDDILDAVPGYTNRFEQAGEDFERLNKLNEERLKLKEDLSEAIEDDDKDDIIEYKAKIAEIEKEAAKLDTNLTKFATREVKLGTGMITPAFEQFNRTQQLEEQALASGARQGGVTIVDRSTVTNNDNAQSIQAIAPTTTDNQDSGVVGLLKNSH